ncbi:MAG: GntR family transcriptional regulator [FCB group bacterium]|nr:GntR family transcriptional regulator [FCB group bacterium]
MENAASQTTYERLLERIVQGAYPPATRLVNRTVAQELGVSVIPVREALGRLASEGLLEHVPGAGSFVRALDSRELVKLYAFRKQLEVFAVAEAARNAQEYQIQHMQRCCENSANALKRIESAKNPELRNKAVEGWVQADAAFHSAIIDAADNMWLTLAVERLRVLAHVSRAKPRDVDVSIYKNTLREHVAIARAIERRDAAKAETLMRKHIQRAMKSVLAETYE